ncbi:MAG: hypothetical protein AAB947_01080 [Patescibacteria group bacterium]
MKKQVATKKAKKPIGFEDLNDKLDLVITHMATRDDLAEAEARLDNKIDAVDEKHTQKFNEILIAVDGIATRLDRKDLNDAIVDRRLNRHEEWAKTFAGKLDVELKY